MATATYVEGVRAGAGAIDCAISPMAGFSAQPPVETLAAIFSETNYSADLDIEALERIAKYFLELAPRRRQSRELLPVIDPNILIHQIPGGMISNFRSQLATQKALDKLPEALEEVTRVRKDLGWPPLVTPTSQIVGTQAVMNVLSGERYKIVPNEVKNYVKGMYGRSPASIDKAFQKKILGKEKPITHRPADEIEPMLPRATDGLDPKFIESEEDIISYVILPEPSLEFFRWRALPPEHRPKTPADLELEKMRQEEQGGRPSAPASVQSSAAEDAERLLPDTDYRGLGELLKTAKGLGLSELTIRKGSFNLALRSGAKAAVTIDAGGESPDAQGVPEVEGPPAREPEHAPEVAAESAPAYAETINAPLAGTFYSNAGPGKPAFVKPGDTVKGGDTVCIVEAMKLFNEIKAPKAGKIVAFLVKDGDAVEKDQPLIGFDPA
jgi:oxaloacetate decarboxylase alpha subunit